MENKQLFKGKTLKEVTLVGVKDIFTGWSMWESVYAFILLGIQVVALFVEVPGAEAIPLWIKVISFITGMSGTICVLLVAKGKISNYFFGVIQTGFGVFVGGYHRLIGETLENAMYLVFQFVGAKEWAKNMEEAKEENAQVVKTKKFHWMDWVLTVVSIAGLTYLIGTVFNFFNGNFGFTDAFTLVVAVVAQLLMTYRYREQWVIWFALDIVSVWQFFNAGNTSMFALYVALTINTVYGYYNWTKTVEKSNKGLPILTQFNQHVKAKKAMK